MTGVILVKKKEKPRKGKGKRGGGASCQQPTTQISDELLAIKLGPRKHVF